MPNFCTHCGAPTEAGNRYCEQCGSPLGAQQPNMAPATPRGTEPQVPEIKLPALSPKARKTLIAACVGVAVSSVALYFILQDPAPPNAENLTQIVNADPGQLVSLTCLDNFDYSKSPVYVNGSDTGTQEWLNILVNAGLYTKPQIIQTGGWFPSTRLEYQHTPAAQQAIKEDKLCYAKGIIVEDVSYEPSAPNSSNAPKTIRGTANFKYDQPAQWATSADAKQRIPDRFGMDKYPLQITLILKDGKWKLATPGDMYSSQARTADSFTPHAPAALSGISGIFNKLTSLFAGNPGSAILGDWVSTGYPTQNITFGPDSLTEDGNKIPVHYKKDGDQIMVIRQDPEREIARIQQASANQLLLTNQFGDTQTLVRRTD